MIYTAIDTFYLKDEQISKSPSRKDNVDEETERTLRQYGCELIQESGILLKLPQAVMATGQVLFHRFYCKKSFARFNVKRMAASCVLLAAKVEESPREIRAVLDVFHRVECRRDAAPLDLLDRYSKKYEEMKRELIKAESRLLKEMGFICHVEHPHKFAINYILQLDAGPLMQDAWSMANDSLRTTLCVRYKSEVVACGVVYAVARRHRLALPENPPWWEAFDANKPEIDEVCSVLANLYQRPKAKYIEVGRDVKPCVLTSRAADTPPDVQDSSLRTVVNGAGPTSSPPTSSIVEKGLSGDAASAAANGVEDNNRSSGANEVSKPLDGGHVPSTNGDARDHTSVAKSKHVNNREDTTGEKSREKDRAEDRERERVDRDRERSRGRGQDRERDEERERFKERDDRIRDRSGEGDREKERSNERDYRIKDTSRQRDKEREQIKERDYWIKDRSRDSGHSHKVRHLSSSRDRNFQNLREKDRQWQRHRSHPYA